MKAHISPELTVEDKAIETISKARNSYIIAGGQAVCAVIYEKATDKSLTAEERLANVIDFCERNLKEVTNDWRNDKWLKIGLETADPPTQC